MDAEAAVEAVTRLGLDPAAEAEIAGDRRGAGRLVPSCGSCRANAGDADAVALADPPRTTIPFPPVILPIEDGPPTYVYGDELTRRARPDRPESAGAAATRGRAERPVGCDEEREGKER